MRRLHLTGLAALTLLTLAASSHASYTFTSGDQIATDNSVKVPLYLMESETSNLSTGGLGSLIFTISDPVQDAATFVQFVPDGAFLDFIGDGPATPQLIDQVSSLSVLNFASGLAGNQVGSDYRLLLGELTFQTGPGTGLATFHLSSTEAYAADWTTPLLSESTAAIGTITVPEPATAGLFAFGAMGTLALRRRRPL